jgi:hypothetical protein
MKKSLLILITLIALFASCKKEKVDIPANATEEKTSGKYEKNMDPWDEFVLEQVPGQTLVIQDDGFDIYLYTSVTFDVLAMHRLPSVYAIYFWYSRVDPQRGGGVIYHSLSSTDHTVPTYYPGHEYLDYTRNLVETRGTIGLVIPQLWDVVTITRYIDATVYNCHITVAKVY